MHCKPGERALGLDKPFRAIHAARHVVAEAVIEADFVGHAVNFDEAHELIERTHNVPGGIGRVANVVDER